MTFDVITWLKNITLPKGSFINHVTQRGVRGVRHFATTGHEAEGGGRGVKIVQICLMSFMIGPLDEKEIIPIFRILNLILHKESK